MSPLSNSSATITTTAALHQLLSLFMADTLTFFSFLSHHPLHLIYLILSFPYLLPIISFLSPLLLSTSILLLLTLLITTSPLSHHHPHSLLALLAVLKHNLDDKDVPSAGLMVIANELLQALIGNPETTQLCLSGQVVEHAGHRVLLKQRSMSVGGRRELCGPEVLQRDGSMRKETEWKRTLACKLYEERITFKLCDETAVAAGKGEEMDLLWEAYEYDTGSKNSKGKKDGDQTSIVEQQQQQDKRSEVDADDEVAGRLCCLQALTMSTRKMSLRGVGATNMMKVLKRIGLFQSVGGSRRGTSRRNK